MKLDRETAFAEALDELEAEGPGRIVSGAFCRVDSTGTRRSHGENYSGGPSVRTIDTQVVPVRCRSNSSGPWISVRFRRIYGHWSETYCSEYAT